MKKNVNPVLNEEEIEIMINKIINYFNSHVISNPSLTFFKETNKDLVIKENDNKIIETCSYTIINFHCVVNTVTEDLDNNPLTETFSFHFTVGDHHPDVYNENIITVTTFLFHDDSYLALYTKAKLLVYQLLHEVENW